MVSRCIDLHHVLRNEELFATAKVLADAVHIYLETFRHRTPQVLERFAMLEQGYDLSVVEYAAQCESAEASESLAHFWLPATGAR